MTSPKNNSFAPLFQNKFKHKTETVDDIRSRRRHEEAALRRERRESLRNSKRIRIDDNSEDENDILEEEVTAAAKQLQQGDRDRRSVLQLLKRGFSQGTALIDAFLRVDGAMNCLVGLFTGSDTELQLEAAWCLTNIAAGVDDHAMLVLRQAGPYLVTFLGNGSPQLQDQCSWAIGNLAGGQQECRDLLRSQGVVPQLVNLLKSPVDSVVQSASFALSNLARGGSEIISDMVNCGILPLTIHHLNFTGNSSKLEVMSEVAWVLAYVSASGAYENAILSLGALDKITVVLVYVAKKEADDFLVTTPLLRCLGNLLGSCQAELTAVEAEDDQLMGALKRLLQSPHRHIRKEALWVVSNLAASKVASDRIVGNGLIGPIIDELNSAVDIKKEAAYCLCNIGSHGADLCRKLLSEGALAAIIPCLKVSDPEIIRVGLSLTEMMLRCTEEGQRMFEESRGLDALELLEYHENEELRDRTNCILDKYFYKDDQEDREAGDHGRMDT